MKELCLAALKKFSQSRDGAVALIVGITLLVVLIAILSLTIDMGRTQASYSLNQDATDAAATGTAEFILKNIISQIGTVSNPFSNPPSDAQIKSYAEKLLLQNFATTQNSATYDPTSLNVTYTSAPDPARAGSTQYTVKVSACANLQTPLATAAGHATSTRTCTTSNAAFSLAALNNLEVAFALDFTNSMYWQGDNPPTTANDPRFVPFSQTKAKALIDAMDFVIDTYFTDPTIYGSIVPYSGLVNIYPYNKTMITPASGNITEADLASPHDFDDIGNFIGSDYKTGVEASPFYLDYRSSLAYTLDRIPLIADITKVNNIVSSDGNPASVLPFDSYSKQLTNLKNEGVDHAGAVGLCYDGVVNAALDQRIERLENHFNGATNTLGYVDTKGFVVSPNYRVYTNPINQQANEALYQINVGTDDHGNRPADTDTTNTFPSPITGDPNARSYEKTRELHESFPIQPLTNNAAILKNVVDRYTANTLLYNDDYSDGSSPANVIDGQQNILNKAIDWSVRPQTSSIHGLLWAWFTINNHWQGQWDAPSLHELYFANSNPTESTQSRQGLPSSTHVKHIIFITDGHDNDGEDPSQNFCDAYSPVAAFPETQYQQVCTQIKNDNVKIHTLLLDFAEPNSHRYSNCASPGEFHENVQPDQVKPIMDGIFKEIITSLVTVQLVK